MDRMADLRRLSTYETDSGEGGADGKSENNSTGDAASRSAAIDESTRDADALLATFAERAADVQRHAADVRRRSATLRRLQQQLQTLPLFPSTEEDGAEHRESTKEHLHAEIAQLMREIHDNCIAGKDGVRAMEHMLQALKRTAGTVEANAGVVRMMENQYGYALKRLMEAVQEYQSVEEEHKKAVRVEAQRHIKIKYTHSDGSGIDDATAEALATEVLEIGVENAIFQQAKDTLHLLIENRNDILRIERSMRELSQLFNDLAVLVHAQGEVLDSVQINVQRSVQFVEKGRRELQAAKKHAKANRCKICVIILVILVIALFIIVPVLALTIPIPDAVVDFFNTTATEES